MAPYCAQKTFWGYFFWIKKENQLEVDSSELKVNWFQLKSFLLNRFLGGSKGKSIESGFK